MKSILITGAASGIGKSTARLFAEKGWFVALADLDKHRLEITGREIGQIGHCEIYPLDVTRYQDFKETVDHLAEHTGSQLHVIFNCAGMMHMGTFEQNSIDEHHLTIDVNVNGIINGIYAALDLLKRTPNARIISMSSAAALYGVPELASYSASKFAVRGLTEALNLELEPHDITVTDIMPLYVDTPMIRSQEHKAGTYSHLGANLTPEDIAKVVWQAAHEKRVHWVPGMTLKALNFVSRFFPFAGRRAMKLLSRNSTTQSIRDKTADHREELSDKK